MKHEPMGLEYHGTPQSPVRRARRAIRLDGVIGISLRLFRRYLDRVEARSATRRIRAAAVVGEHLICGPSTTVNNEGPRENIRIGDRVSLLGVELHAHARGRIVIGDGTWMSLRAQVLCWDSIQIGAFSIFARDVFICDAAAHPADPALRLAQTRALQFEGTLPDRYDGVACAPIVIGSNVFVGERAFVMRGVTVGDDAVVGAGAVVVKDVPAGAIVAGNPARVVKWAPGYGASMGTIGDAKEARKA
jgi:acetyltransferase-like isoleucine patch superfamily enzyme